VVCNMTPSEYFTNQYYQWEQRTRGWYISDVPVELEPPFMPFFRHGFHQPNLDEGKRHTIVSRIIDSFKSKPIPEIIEEPLDYITIHPFEYVREGNLKALQIKLGKDRKVTPDKMKALLTILSNTSGIVSFEIIGDNESITIQFVCEYSDLKLIEINIRAYFPECIIIESDILLDLIIEPNLYTATTDLGLYKEIYRPINCPKNYQIDPLTSFISVLEQLNKNEQAGIQILFKGTVNSWSDNILHSVTLNSGKSFFEDDANAPKLAMEKVQSPLYAVTIRCFAQAPNKESAFSILENIVYSIINASASSNNNLFLLDTEFYDFDTRVDDIIERVSHRIGMLLNTDELACLLHFPSENIVSKKLNASNRKTYKVPSIASNKEFILGVNNHNGNSQSVGFSQEDRLKHTHIIGATGTGKSTLIANLINQDILKNYGVILFDPHGDLIDDVISHIPQERINDVVLIDPSDSEYSIGLNILQANSEIEKEVLSGDLVASFKKSSTSWGDQMNSVLGNAILAILENKQGGSLHDLRRFLIENDFRNNYLKNVTDPNVVYYWQKEYPLQRSNSIGSILTRLDSFLRPRSIRNMIIQKQGLDFENLLNTNKIILFKLSQGLIGTENSFLLGSLFLSKIHQAILRRQQSSNRNPIFMYLDEFQNFITPSIKEMLSGIRKYNVGLTLSHQDLQQLQREDGELLNSVLGNVNNRVVFRVGEPDAKKLKDGFEHFDVLDFQNLGKGEAIFRIEQPQFDCSLDTFLPKKVSDDVKNDLIERVVTSTREKYATSKTEIEKSFFESLNIPIESVPPKEYKQPVLIPVTPIEIKQEIKEIESPKDVSVHRYLQTLVKKMAEQRGYVATIEELIPNGDGQVDVLLSKEAKTIAVEISNTTEANWEVHNIIKCIEAKYDTIVSLSGDPKQLDRIRKKCEIEIKDFNTQNILFFTPDAFFTYLDNLNFQKITPAENVMKGYRVNVSYDSIPNEDMEQKRKSIASVIVNSLKKSRK
jgi:hypothetical protein